MPLDSRSTAAQGRADPALSPLSLRLFGPFEALVGGEPLPRLHSKKEPWLLALLAPRAPRRVERAWLAGTLWPESSEERALHYLRTGLTHLRHALGPESRRLLSPTRSTLSLDLDGADVDLLAFDGAIARGDVASLEHAISLYRGPLLEGCLEDWAVPEREARERACRAALEMLADHARAEGDLRSAADRLRQVIGLDPLRESAHRGLMTTLAESGQAAEATQVYRELREILRRGMNVEPSAETQSLFRRIREGTVLRVTGRNVGAIRSNGDMPAEPAARSPDCPIPPSPIRRLPRPLTPLIGREKEALETASLLASNRLVTLFGPGGVGKTRLAIRAAEAAAAAHPDSVRFVDLAPASDANGVPAAALAALQIELRPEELPLETLQRTLQSRRLLLVIDNCEHVVEGCSGMIEALLAQCPDLRVLATSREVLRIPGETVYPVPALFVPEGEMEPTAEAVAEFEAARLLLDRIRAAQPSFQLTPTSARAIGEICRRLEGIPLALELAASRARAMCVEEIAGRLGEALSLLGRGNRTAQPRHRTLVATLDWSYRRLSEEEQWLLRRLSVFAGSWTLEAAEAVGHIPLAPPNHGGRAESSGPAGRTILDLLAGLVEKSMAEVTEGEEGQSRYRYLETIRQFGIERLREAEEEAEARSRHLDYYVGLAERADAEMHSPGQTAWVRRLRREYDNLRAAFATAEAEGDGERGLRLAGALKWFWAIRCDLGEGFHWVERMLTAPGSRVRTAARAKALYVAGHLAWFRHDFARDWWDDRLAGWLDESVGIARQLEDRRLYAYAVFHRDQLASGTGDCAANTRLLDEIVDLFREAGDTAGLAKAYIHLGVISSCGWGSPDSPETYRAEDFDLARSLIFEGLKLFRELGDPWYSALALSFLGGMSMGQSFEEVEAHYAELLSLAKRNDDFGSQWWCLNWLGEAALRSGDYRRALTLLEEATCAIAQVSWGSADAKWTTDLLEEVNAHLEGAERYDITKP